MLNEAPYNYEGEGFSIKDNILIGQKKHIDTTGLSIGELILEALDKNPERVSQIDAKTGKKTTNGDMKDASIRVAVWLRKQKIGAGDVVSICTHNHLDAYIPVLSTLYVGAIYNSWHHEVTLALARHLMRLMNPKIMFCCESSVPVILEAAKLEDADIKVVVFGNYPGLESIYDILDQQSNRDVSYFTATKIVNEDHIGLVLFSSGTTGLPKGVAHSYRSLLRSIVAFTHMQSSKDDIRLWYSSLYWISGTYLTLQTIITNSTRILHDDSEPNEMCKVIEKYKISWLFAAPTSMVALSKSNALANYNLKSLKTLLTGGSKLNKHVLDEVKKYLPDVDITQGYGMTEVGGLGTMQNKNTINIDSVGFVAINTKIKFVDTETGQALGPNREGEIYFKSEGRMVCYYNNPVSTADTFDEHGWLKSGDVGYYDKSGQVFITDRIKEVMKYRGHHVSPTEIEEVLLKHPDILEVAVVPVLHPLDCERPMAFVKKAPNAKINEDDIVILSEELGPIKKLHGGVQFLDSLPYTASGKICRKELKNMAKAYNITS